MFTPASKGKSAVRGKHSIWQEILNRSVELAASTTERFKISCQLECPSRTALLPFDAGVNIHLYRIAQEAISNAVKHGEAKHIVIRLEVTNGETVLSVTDDG